MSKVNKDDIGAIASRLDAQTAIMIELIAEAHGMNAGATSAKYRKKYDKMAARFREEIIS